MPQRVLQLFHATECLVILLATFKILQAPVLLSAQRALYTLLPRLLPEDPGVLLPGERKERQDFNSSQLKRPLSRVTPLRPAGH